MASLALHLLGSPRIEVDNIPIVINRRKVLALLVYLTLTRHPHRRDHLATLLWPDYDQTSARGNLRRALSTLNQTLTGEWLQIDGEQVSLKRDDNLWLDVDQFHEYLTNSTTHGHPASEVCIDCLEPLGRAVTLYQDDLLTGFTLPDSPEFDDWQLFQTESLRRELAETLEKLVRGHGTQGEFDPAIEFARRWLTLDPLQESAHRQLMRLLTLSGQRNAALTQYESCRQILADELGVEPAAETTRLYEQIRAGDLSGEAAAQTNRGEAFSDGFWPSHSAAPRHNLPSQLTPFIGRVEEVAEIIRLIRDEPTCHLLTLVGPGGIGKTRLVLQAAAQTIELFPDGVYFVSLAPLSTAESVLPKMADALSFPLSGGNPKEQLLNYLSKKTMLLVLDNFEQFIPLGVTDLLSEMIIRAPQIKLLVTSRERLNLQEEWGLEVRGLRFPTGTETEETSLELYEGIQLFVQRAQRARPGFILSTENSAHIVRIGQLVQGMPLGLELAATWLRMMTCREIAQEIDKGLDFLTTSLRDVPKRHQSLRAVFEQSWQLLTKEERAIFRRLSVFRGGFRYRAAERVADASLSLLSALVDKSLLRRTRAGRYEIHELLRQYAAERLNRIPDEMGEAQDRHADYYLTFLQQRTDDLRKGQRVTVAEIMADIDNIRTGWQRAVAQRNVTSLGNAANGLLHFSLARNWLQEGEAAFRQAVQSLTEEQAGLTSTVGEQTKRSDQKTQSKIVNLKPALSEVEGSKIVLAQLLRGQGRLSAVLGLIQPGQDLLRQSVSLLRQAEGGLQPELAFSLHALAMTYWFQGLYSDAQRHFEESLAIYTEVGDRSGMGEALLTLGMVATYQGEYAEANRLLQESLGLFRQAGQVRLMLSVLLTLGIVARTRGEYEPAERFLTESLQTSRYRTSSLRESGYLAIEAYSLRELGYLVIARGNYRQAKKQLQESLLIFKDTGARVSSVFPLDGLGTIARLQGDYQQAEQLHQESLTICREIGEGRGIALCLYNLGRLAYDMEDYPTAEQRLQESLVRYQEIGNQYGVASALCHLGYVACAVGSDRYQEAGQYFKQALEITTRIGANPLTLNILVGLATLLTTAEPGDAEREQAVELLALALHHPASEQETKDRARWLLNKLVASLSPESVAAAQERGKAEKLDTVLLEMLETAV